MGIFCKVQCEFTSETEELSQKALDIYFNNNRVNLKFWRGVVTDEEDLEDETIDFGNLFYYGKTASSAKLVGNIKDVENYLLGYAEDIVFKNSASDIGEEIDITDENIIIIIGENNE